MRDLMWAQSLFVAARGGGHASPLVIVLIVLAMAALVLYGLYAAAKRRRELAAWAGAHGLSFSDEKIEGLDGQYPEFSCLRFGHSRYACNIIRGQWNGRGMLGFDYHYVTGSGKNRQVHLFSAVTVDSTVLLQPLTIRPENFLDKIGEFFGADDIDFESAEFSKRFYVKAADKRWAYDVIHPRTIEFLLASPQFAMQFGLRGVICYRGGTFAPADFEAACQVVCGVLDRLPEYLVAQQRQMYGAGHGDA